VANVANAQLQEASLNNQNAAVQAQAQVQEDTAALATQASNNQQEAALAATVAQSNAAVQTASLAANVQNTQTAAAENVANTQVNAALTAQQTQTAAEESSLQNEFSYLTQANTNTTAEVNQLIPQLGTHTGNYSQTLASLISSLEGQTTSSVAQSNLALGQQTSQNNATASEVNTGVTAGTGAINNLLNTLFG
jgi:hypothetical protein